MVMINSDKGEKIWESLSDSIVAIEKKIDDIIYGNPSFKNSVSINQDSEKFLELLDEVPFSVALSRYYKKPGVVEYNLQRISNKLKSALKKIT